jgi:hypothetical protein
MLLMAYLQLTCLELDRHVHLLLTQWDHLEPSDAQQYGEEPEALNLKHVSNGHCWTLSRGDPKSMP